MSGTELKQRLAAILAADVAGYSRLMAADERGTVAALDSARTVFRAQIESNQGRVIDMAGDSVLAVFETATGAVSAALAVQKEIRLSGESVPEERRMRFRIGIHLGDVIEKADGTVYGDGVNIAARLEGLAEPGGITVSESIRTAVKGRVSATFEDQGAQQVKNIAEPVRAFRILIEAMTAKPKPAIGEIDLSLPDKPSIAVLPFANLSGDPEQEYFTDGVTEDILTELSRFRTLFVIARNSSFTYKGKAADVRNVARDLGVRYVLEGSIRRAGARIRVTAQLIDALTGNHIWAERFDRVVEDIFAVQEEVTQAIVAAIAPQIDAAELAKARRLRPGNLSAYEIAARAWADSLEAYVKADGALRSRAIREAKEALAIDPRSVLALHALGGAQFQHVFYKTTADPEAAWEESLSSTNRIIELDCSDNRAYWRRGMLFLFAPGGARWDEALTNLRHAHDLNSNDVFALTNLGFAESVSGNPRRGIDCLMRSLRISPLSPLIYRVHDMVGVAYFFARDYVKSVEWASLAISQAPIFPLPYFWSALAYVGLDEIDKAKAALATARRIAPEFIQNRLDGYAPYRKAEDKERVAVFLRIAAGLEDTSAADPLR